MNAKIIRMAARQEMKIADGSDPEEAARGVRLCLKGTWDWPEESADGSSWEAWQTGGAVSLLARHVVQIMALAQRGAFQQIIATDAALELGLMALFREEISPATPDALWKRLHRALAAGEMPGRLATLCAVNAVTFHLGTLTALQSVLFLEWQARWKSGKNPATVQRFLSTNGPLLQHLSTHLRPHDSLHVPRFSIC